MIEAYFKLIAFTADEFHDHHIQLKTSPVAMLFIDGVK